MQIKSIDPITLKKRLDEGSVVLIDVREPNEHAREHIEGAKLVPLSRFQAEDFADLRDKTAVFHCHSGGRTTANAQLLTSKGFRDAYQLGGGIVAWKAAGLPTRSQQ
jgi:rhodanese-related sulfurtransferase